MSNPNNNPKLTTEQIRQLLAMQQQAGVQEPQPSKGQMRLQNFMSKLIGSYQKILHFLDRFINFVSRSTDQDRNDVIQAARPPILFGIYVIILFVVFGGLWSALAPLDSAATVGGTVIASSNRKTIIHQEGGTLKAIYVQAGDKIKEGDKLVEFDDTRNKAQYEEVLHHYKAALAAESRLVAERDNLDKILFHEFLLKDENNSTADKFLNTQENLFRSNREKTRIEKENLKQKTAQLHKQIEGIKSKKVANIKNLEITRDRLHASKSLMEKGYTNKSAVLELQGREAALLSEVANADIDIAKTEQDITRTEIESINIENTALTKTLAELKETQVQVSTFGEKYIHLKDALDKSIIKSPVDGIVNVVNFHTVGSVIPHLTPIMEISPLKDTLVIEAKIPAKNIDSVHVGLVAKIKFSAFKSRTTPLFQGKLVSLSPDIVASANQQQMHDPNGPYYIARIEINMDEFNKIAKERHLELHPGMQAEIQVVTGTRTLLRYLLDPVIDTMFKSFKEK